MKTTLEIPDAIFRRAKSKAAAQGVNAPPICYRGRRGKIEIGRLAGSPG
jgi:hypothetical protein